MIAFVRDRRAERASSLAETILLRRPISTKRCHWSAATSGAAARKAASTSRRARILPGFASRSGRWSQRFMRKILAGRDSSETIDLIHLHDAGERHTLLGHHCADAM